MLRLVTDTTNATLAVCLLDVWIGWCYAQCQDEHRSKVRYATTLNNIHIPLAWAHYLKPPF